MGLKIEFVERATKFSKCQRCLDSFPLLLLLLLLLLPLLLPPLLAAPKFACVPK